MSILDNAISGVMGQRMHVMLASVKDRDAITSSFIKQFLLPDLSDGVAFTVTKDVSTSRSAQVTTHAVEKGEAVSSHVRAGVTSKSMNALIADENSFFGLSFDMLSFLGSKSMQEKLDLLTEWCQNGEPLVWFGYGTEEVSPCVITSFSDRMGVETGTAAREVSITLQKIVFAEVGYRDISIERKNTAAPPASKGKPDNADPAKVTEKPKSILKGAIG